MTPAAVEEFLAHVNRRRAVMAIGGAVAIGAGVAGIVIVGGGSSAIWFGGLALLGLMVAFGATTGASMVKDVKTVAAGASANMELSTWPYRSTPQERRIDRRGRPTSSVPSISDRPSSPSPKTEAVT